MNNTETQVPGVDEVDTEAEDEHGDTDETEVDGVVLGGVDELLGLLPEGGGSLFDPLYSVFEPLHCTG